VLQIGNFSFHPPTRKKTKTKKTSWPPPKINKKRTASIAWIWSYGTTNSVTNGISTLHTSVYLLTWYKNLMIWKVRFCIMETWAALPPTLSQKPFWVLRETAPLAMLWGGPGQWLTDAQKIVSHAIARQKALDWRICAVPSGWPGGPHTPTSHILTVDQVSLACFSQVLVHILFIWNKSVECFQTILECNSRYILQLLSLNTYISD
jgi:hypothetical protein